MRLPGDSPPPHAEEPKGGRRVEARAASSPLLEARAVTRRFGGGGWFGTKRPALVAVDNVSLPLGPGETLGIVGESGSGKSTLARMLVGLLQPSAGDLALDGEALDLGRGADRRRLQRRAQMVFQDPASAMNPRKTVGASVEAPMIGLKGWDAPRRKARVAELFARVGLAPEHAARHPHEFSGGQLQRIGIARALSADPRIVVLDEPVSALDVSVQAQVLALLRELRAGGGLSLVFVSHDLAVVEALCDRVVVMRRGRVVEEGACRAVLSAPREDYTRELIQAARRFAA
ncbi:ABC transporter ATP-binding protein [Methylopila sp. Yamaguchi]|uniref:ABC transporter ATP-binding protein n=1 Tax=Methylopila sp. Yamaguchi TaxID=1437817 RepID=UPI000CB07811|nr:ATP-binding cassette domain-containing protein [Methylopila sp. Yamaguchi]GBD49708.1 oligopeptide/dipeptide ABC transporter ATPase [Methylopila sp. Yamaguchi]